MGFVELFLIAVGLSMDAFAVAVCKGLAMRRVDWRAAVVLALLFGGFQALMPLIGWAVGSQLMWLIEPFDHWVAFALLAFIGGKMLLEAIRGGDSGDGVAEAEEAADSAINLPEYLMLAVATSIDALAVGVSFAALEVSIAPSVACIGVTTFVLSLLGVVVGNQFGSRYERAAGIAGGTVLIAIGVKILLEGLGVIG